MRIAALSALYGLIAGIVTAAILWAMGLVTHLVWAGPEARWYIFLVILCGGALIAALRHFAGEETTPTGLNEQLRDIREPHVHQRRQALLVAAMAVVAVGFGGAIGPEAGILAIVGELSALIGMRLARDQGEARLLREAGAAGALGGLCGSPPGGAVVVQEHPEAPRWQLYLAALTGLFGFLLVARLLLPDPSLHVALPAYTPAGDGTDMLRSVVPALLGAGTGLAFVAMLGPLQSGLKRLGGPVVQTLAGTLCFAALAAALPILRFSGHHALEAMLHWGQQAGVAALLLLALLKALALALCLASGWRGGAAFPLIFIGAAAGGAALWLLPATPATVALVAGIVAALTAGMGKPLAAMLIALLLLGLAAPGPICVGAAVGWAASRLIPKPRLH